MKVFYELDEHDVRNIIAEKYEISPEKVIMMDIVMGRGFVVKVDMSATETPGEAVSIPVPDPEDDDEVPQETPAPTDDEQIDRQQLLLKAADAANLDDPEARYRYLCDKELDSLIAKGYTVAQICKQYNLELKYQYRLYKVIGDRKKAAKEPSKTEADKQILRELKKVQKKEKDEHGVIWYICPVCKKRFNTEKYPEYSYKDSKHVFCGYDCMRKAQKSGIPD